MKISHPYKKTVRICKKTMNHIRKKQFYQNDEFINQLKH